MFKKTILLLILISNAIATPSNAETNIKPAETSIAKRDPIQTKPWYHPQKLYKQFITWKRETLNNPQSPNHPWNILRSYGNSLVARFKQPKIDSSKTKTSTEMQIKTNPRQTAATVTTIAENFDKVTVPVLQQDSSTPWVIKRADKTEADIEANNHLILNTPELLWKDVRMQEGLNCGYHALKNISIIMREPLTTKQLIAQLANPNSSLSQSLKSSDFFIRHIELWAPVIRSERKDAIARNLHLETPYPNNFKEQRRSVTHGFMQGYIDANTGRIKTNHLFANEVEKLVNEEFPALEKNIVVCDDFDDMHYTTKGKKQLARIQQFKKAQNDRLGILWTEPEFNHWVGYVALKENGKVTLYYLNSIDSVQPSQTQALIDLLKP